MARKANLGLTIVAALAVLALCGAVHAFSGEGFGTETDPYIITDVYQLQEMQDDLDAYYVLGNDIDASDTVSWNGGAGFEPVGYYIDEDNFFPFTGKFDGQGYTITGVYINRPTTDGVGVFGYIRDGAEVKNVGLVDADVTAHLNSGTLVGSSNGATVSKSWSSGEIQGSHNYQMRLGGLLGISSGANSYVYQCFSSVNVIATGGAHQIGGLSGYNGHGSIMSDCYATGNVSGHWKVGGLVGDNPYPEGGYITRCYSTGKVSGDGGGLVGFNYKGGKTYDSYWDTQTSGKSSSYGGTPKTTAQMKQQTTFVNWDFDEIWDIVEGQTYPFFREPRVLESLEIVGPSEVAEDSQAHYKAIAYYDIGSTKDVTDSADWSVEPNDIASIAAGLLTTEMVDLPTDITITAQYSEGDVNETAEKDVSIFAICPSGSALEFDGVDDYVTANIGTTTGNITYLFWFKSDNVGTTKRIVTRNWSSGGSFTSHHANGILWIAYRATDGTQPHLEGGQIVSDTWYHIAFVFNGTHGELYVNGNPKDTSNKLLLPLDSNHLWIGARKYDFNGSIDDVRIYDRALSAEEIWASMHTRPEYTDPTLVGYWNFDEGEGQVAGDSSVYGNNGTVVGAIWTDSIPPVGICGVEGIVERNLSDVLNNKLSILEQLYETMAQEEALWEYMDIVFKDRDFGNTSKGDVVKAKQKIMGAIQQEEQAETAVDQSIDKLDDALNTLGLELNSQE